MSIPRAIIKVTLEAENYKHTIDTQTGDHNVSLFFKSASLHLLYNHNFDPIMASYDNKGYPLRHCLYELDSITFVECEKVCSSILIMRQSMNNKR